MIAHCSKKWHKFFKAACDPQRQRILEMIRRHKELNASQIVVKIKLSQPTISHHLKILTEASLVKAQKKGKEVFYSINKNNIGDCCRRFMEIFA